MYVTQKIREKRKKVDVDIYLSNENFIKAYKTDSAISINKFVKEVYFAKGKTDEAYYLDTQNEEHKILIAPFFDIMNGDTPDIKVSKEGVIIVFNKEDLIATLDFNDYQLISVDELRVVGDISGELETIKGNNLVFYDRNYHRRIEIPFHIEYDFTSQGFGVTLALDFECKKI